MSGSEWGSLNDILGRLEDVDEDLRDLSEDVDTAVGTANAARLCGAARDAVGELRQLIVTAPKLVRDLVPVANVRVADPDEMPALLRDKLREEVAEYLESGDPVELADILEVLYALAETHRIGPAGLDGLREAKAAGMGRFAHRLVWLGNEDGAS